MANPKRKISRSKRDMRRAHWFRSLTSVGTISCSYCGEAKLPHRACPSCGQYRGKSIFVPKKA